MEDRCDEPRGADKGRRVVHRPKIVPHEPARAANTQLEQPEHEQQRDQQR